MSDIDDIYSALLSAKDANEALSTWVRSIDGRDRVDSHRLNIDRGIAAYYRLAADLRDGRKHIEMPDDFKATGCMCSWPNASPPCSWCTDPENNPEKEPS